MNLSVGLIDERLATGLDAEVQVFYGAPANHQDGARGMYGARDTMEGSLKSAEDPVHHRLRS